MDLQTPIEKGGRVFKLYRKRLEKLGIRKFEDFLFHVPFRYEDYSIKSKIGEVQPGETVTVTGRVLEISNIFTRKFTKIQKATIDDGTGKLNLIWFNQPYITKLIKKGDQITVSGKAEKNLNKLQMTSPAYEIAGQNIHTGRLVPIYPETKGVSSKWIRTQVKKILETSKINEHLPYSLLKKLNLKGLNQSIEQIHFPDSLENADDARERIAFDELFLLQTKALIRKNEWSKGKAFKFEVNKNRKKIEFLEKDLSFKLTSAQKTAIEEVFNDLASEKKMNRLLQGDVGSGKTVVSAFAIYLSFLNGYQSIFMAPTEILANQHFTTLEKIFSNTKIKIGLATSSRKLNLKEKNDLLIGTHALLSKSIKTEKLGLVVIDEQQKFGVEQRSTLLKKGVNPHLLAMTATPIPRTVALTLYGDLDVSVLDEMPIGRKKVKTWLVPVEKRNNAYNWIKKQVLKDRIQAFIICPLIEESENLTTVRAAKKEFENLKKIFSELRLGLLHGKLKAKEKDKVFDDFKENRINILVATPVVEVGIDVKNATIILIEGSDRFGLAQLHQLRGRVGRGEQQSYCLLFTDNQGEKINKRLKAMETIDVGAKLAEMDLRLRGPGEIFGKLQHGIPNLKVANFSDFELIKKAKEEADRFFPDLKKYPELFRKTKDEQLLVSPN